jgi:hypothetical protein
VNGKDAKGYGRRYDRPRDSTERGRTDWPPDKTPATKAAFVRQSDYEEAGQKRNSLQLLEHESQIPK